MTFSSLAFLCIFLPVVFLLHSVIPVLRVRNALLILASLIFYSYGEPVYVLLLLGSVLINYTCVLFLKGRKWMLILAVILNLSLLVTFKYAGFFVESFNSLTGMKIPVPEISLPIGISFFTFQALSYVIDVYRGDADRETNFFRVLLYISFFPQLIAGPIVRFRDIAAELKERKVSIDEAAPGFRRFLYGLAKKVLIANTMAVVVDAVYETDPGQVNILTAWIVAVAFLLQIYFDAGTAIWPSAWAGCSASISARILICRMWQPASGNSGEDGISRYLPGLENMYTFPWEETRRDGFGQD